MSNQMPRRFIAALLGCCVAFALSPNSSASAEELRIGFLAPMSGILAQIGKDMVDGFQMYLDEHHGKLGGADVKFILEDEQGKPSVAVLKAEKLIREDKAHMLVGGLLASTGYALAPVSTREKILYIASVSSADDLTQRLLNHFPYFVRTGWTSSQPSHPFGKWACDQGYKKIAVVGADYAFGYEAVGGFQKSFEECGGKIIQKIWVPLSTIDFGPYIPAIKQDADAIFGLCAGQMSLQFPKQLRAAGIKKPIIGGGTSYDEFVLPFMGDEAVDGVSPLQYSAAIQTPKNEAFVRAYRAKYGKVPGYYSESNYTTAQIIDETLQKFGGKYPGPEAFIKAMQGLTIEAVRGPVSFDDMRNPVQNIYIKKVERTKMFGYPKAELWNVVIKTYPHVSQFWTYGEKEFLKQPVYSRDFPPCKYCE
jgi:branched-chain amino acid transport system substrate-binding protein